MAETSLYSLELVGLLSDHVVDSVGPFPVERELSPRSGRVAHFYCLEDEVLDLNRPQKDFTIVYLRCRLLVYQGV